jgi:hypothetical protein
VTAAPKVLAVSAAFLAMVAAAVFGAGDGRVLVPPPEIVAGEFARALQTRRYPQARRHLASELQRQVDAAALRRLHQLLEARLGRIQRVRGERGTAPGEAVVVLEASRRRLRLLLRCAREHGQWRVRELPPLTNHVSPLPEA